MCIVEFGDIVVGLVLEFGTGCQLAVESGSGTEVGMEPETRLVEFASGIGLAGIAEVPVAEPLVAEFVSGTVSVVVLVVLVPGEPVVGLVVGPAAGPVVEHVDEPVAGHVVELVVEPVFGHVVGPAAAYVARSAAGIVGGPGTV